MQAHDLHEKKIQFFSHVLTFPCHLPATICCRTSRRAPPPGGQRAGRGGAGPEGAPRAQVSGAVGCLGGAGLSGTRMGGHGESCRRTAIGEGEGRSTCQGIRHRQLGAPRPPSLHRSLVLIPHGGEDFCTLEAAFTTFVDPRRAGPRLNVLVQVHGLAALRALSGWEAGMCQGQLRAACVADAPVLHSPRAVCPCRHPFVRPARRTRASCSCCALCRM